MTTLEYKCPTSNITGNVLTKYHILEAMEISGIAELCKSIEEYVQDLEEFGSDSGEIRGNILEHLANCDSCFDVTNQLRSKMDMKEIFRSHLRGRIPDNYGSGLQTLERLGFGDLRE